MVKFELRKKEINPVGCSAEGFKQSRTGGRKKREFCWNKNQK